MSETRIDPTPETANELLRNLTLRRHIGIMRIERSAARRILDHISAIDADIEAELAARVSRLSARDRATIASGGAFTTQKLKALRETLVRQRREVEEALRLAVIDEVRDIPAFQAASQVQALEQALGALAVQVSTPDARSLRAMVTRKPLQGKVLKEWTKGWAADKVDRLSQQIKLSVAANEGPRKLAKRLKAANLAKAHHAQTLARTAVIDLAAAATERVAEANPQIVKQVQWLATLDARICPRCALLDGRKFKEGEGPRPPLHPNCRCVMVPVTVSYRELGFDIDEVDGLTRASVNGQVPADTTAPQWLRSQPRSVVEDVLGPTRTKLFLDGKLKMERFVDPDTLTTHTVETVLKREAKLAKKLGL